MRMNIALAAAIASFVSAHPGEHHAPVPANVRLARRAHQAEARRGLEACAEHPSFLRVKERAIQRRAETVEYHAMKRKSKRATATLNPTGVGHNQTDNRPDITAASTGKQIFGNSHVCILDPQGEIGPYYVPGELVRKDLVEDQIGVEVILDGQFIDVETCEPLTNLWWDVWNCNSTGVYSGVVEDGNGNTDDAANINATWLRGIQPTDDDGVVQFKTIFPGHYSGRTNHHHMVAWLDAELLPNRTLTSGYVAHINQLFWDQDLVSAVEATYPYNLNTVEQTMNADDHVVADEMEDTESDPFMNYVYLGDDLSDGLFGWVTIGVNKSASYETSYSFTYGENGGTALNETVGGSPVNF